ncbi:hypothetical protein ADEAN_000686000 [Angomonas deanei]|uniref:Uncharacterized protein n=1 Tax=Angomonas deanei TaxID=59799 RepID=A0A7G2CIZ8_9TRYP|nr:hypothetical protein ADEAN_000686000 [Angomonas deanei]
MRALLQKEWSRGELRFWTASLLENGPSPPQQEWSRILNRHDTSTGRVLACPSLEQLPAFQASVAHIGVHLLQHKRTEEVYQLVSAFVCANIPLFESSNVKSVLESFFQKLFPAEEEQIKLLKMVLLACEGNTRVRLIASLFFEDVKGETADTPLLSGLPSITQEKTVAGSVGLRLSDEGLSLLQRIFHSLCLSPGELASAPLLLGDILSLTPAPHPLRAALLESFWRSVWTRVGITEERNGAAPISYSGWLEFLSHLPPHCAEDRHLTLCLYQSMAILSQMKTTAGNEGDGPSGLVDPSVETTVDREWIIQTAAAIVANFTALPPTAISPPMLLNWLVASGQFDVGQAVRYLLAQLQRAKEGGDQAKEVSFVYLAIPIDKIGNTSHLLRLLAALRYLERHETQHSTPHGMEHITYERIRTYVLHMWYVRALSCVFTFLQVNPVALSLSATTQSTLPSERRIPVECLAYFVLQECPLRSPYVSYTHPSHGTTDHTLDHLKKVFTVRHEASPGATPLPTGQGELDLTEASVSSHLYRDVASFTHSSLGSASPVLLHEGLLQDYVAMVAAKLQESHLSARETALETVLEGFLQTVKQQDTMRNRNAAQGDLPDTRLTISTPEFSALCNTMESLLHKS